QPRKARKTNNCCRSSATRLESDQPKLAFNCRYLISNIAINAAQTCVFRALAEVPMKVFTRRFCFKALKNSCRVRDWRGFGVGLDPFPAPPLSGVNYSFPSTTIRIPDGYNYLFL